MHVFIAPLALMVERYTGYPPHLMNAIGHPVIWFGKLIDFLETRVDRRERTTQQRRDAGIISMTILLGGVVLVALLVQQLTRQIPQGWLLEMLLATPFFAQKELGRAVRTVAEALDISLDAGRAEVSQIVGRDADQLDEAEVSRAAIETLAESTSDGIVAPWFWLVLFGLPGIVAYKAINTADSMIGHLNDRYRDFGWAAAKLDDVVNWIPARLSTMLITAACFIVPHASPGKAWATAGRDASGHASPNSGWPEAAFAGALGFSLGGPRSYDGNTVELPRMGSGKHELRGSDILRALQLYRATLNILLGLSLAIALLMLSATG
ncbi:adenosylcobinamide-phosphate synthase CbiB [Devosia rhodophyticola]|uniref:Cobalamin biosynthesis protein CobD n=1 Tax=Devosia rhodophyticola TaxID=3026423 RepID=A0ABY7Z0P2_9HYPH|nr:adenosylcobinamide-phosphate synthase CbiB [Devosia rhodophyticola]WDR06585.1 adenosylcobinamide-phosphate synthase CbiB [Devosia rhodophyticola]